MKMRPIFLLAISMAALAATPASAHWLFARWGMTPEQARAANEAGEGFVPLTKFAFVTEDPASTPDSRILATAEAEPEDTSQPMRVRFGFDSERRLNRILLDLTYVEQCAEIREQFLALAGQPAARDRADMPAVLRWRRLGANDLEIRYAGNLQSPASCSVLWVPAGSLP
jgi:hypothetical protein